MSCLPHAAGRLSDGQRRPSLHRAVDRRATWSDRGLAPAHRAASSPGATATRYVPAEGRAGLLVVRNMPPLPAGKAYQLWLVQSGQRDNGGLLQVGQDGSGFLLVKSPRPLHEYEAAGITMEPAGGSPGPTSPRVIGGRF
ncbi:MAG: anti-sigma factor [Anaerolineae bacterium]|nr:anti-sigma factor [Anaerolineae bacterium]